MMLRGCAVATCDAARLGTQVHSHRISLIPSKHRSTRWTNFWSLDTAESMAANKQYQPRSPGKRAFPSPHHFHLVSHRTLDFVCHLLSLGFVIAPKYLSRKWQVPSETPFLHFRSSFASARDFPKNTSEGCPAYWQEQRACQGPLLMPTHLEPTQKMKI
ncbi:hypothetical protein BS50DRAFT_237302 [Corynespora cassiicola Philippines]|uniref:Uncharacterized protein n=1 Tax=Corynespora cassiicola Philippines TaxID=1448308 RepID=A0A2T2P2F9_CORCC|nr:hypothetical protein BS50DRAFT_237302 [Corynespora cassiicola Philippines]